MKKIAFAFLLSMCMTSMSAADSLTTTFAGGNGQSGNMFDVVVLNVMGVQVEQLDLNLDPGTWDLELWYMDGSPYAGNETNAAAWTLVDTIAGVVSSGGGVGTAWDHADFALSGGATSSIYVTVTNGTAINYTNGTLEGSVLAADSNIQILEGTGNVYQFGTQFRPRNWNGTLTYSVIPEPAALSVLGLAGLGLVARRRK
ncbi:MAG: PEP-CTERM sorting domain-containing protein [Planctomycetota bacterium]